LPWWAVTRAEFLARLEAHRRRVHVGVTGGASYPDRRRVYRVLKWIKPARVFHLAHGVTGNDYTTIQGLDRWADAWALTTPGVTLRRYPGIDPGACLDEETAEGPVTAVLAFPGGGALLGAARARGVPVFVL